MKLSEKNYNCSAKITTILNDNEKKNKLTFLKINEKFNSINFITIQKFKIKKNTISLLKECQCIEMKNVKTNKKKKCNSKIEKIQYSYSKR